MSNACEAMANHFEGLDIGHSVDHPRTEDDSDFGRADSWCTLEEDSESDFDSVNICKSFSFSGQGSPLHGSVGIRAAHNQQIGQWLDEEILSSPFF
eukprot:CAMPEP_0181323212 /NCGR_PEP_ID=MMETSP1101-20121128/19655_1 /TAXON_ID=46948 /ORGANISM="Rhodomonas abbreviata, Strain Caron Lab Isolate" /LENGTH=95 /DNA_ID=CAMNT_0023431205 /DNA_START=68 /DNA_END=355 /DNA_ORIENTATION=+